jgi:DNA-binding response OmpR family regulator
MKKNGKILIIDDEPDIAETMKMLIEREGYKVEYVLDPRKGIEKIKSFDLLLLDIIMPTMSGREVLAEMKKRGIGTPTIVVSAVGLPMEVERELDSKYPGVGFVPKTEMHTILIEEVKKRMRV